MHLGIDEVSQDILAVDLTENSVGDQEHLSDLLDDLPKDVKLKQVTGDGIYNSHACYEDVCARGAKFVTPPRRNSVLPRGRPLKNEPLRTRAVRDCRRRGPDGMEKTSPLSP
ncbi:MAG: transposase [Bdellovibrionales bacterium]